MKPLTPEQRRLALKSFVEEPESNLAVLDRSTLERWATCPFQAAAVSSGRVMNSSDLTAAGEEVHQALSRVTRNWIDSDGQMSAADIKQDLLYEITGARPDVQPDAIKGVVSSAYHWARFLWSIHPGNILAFDDGEDVGRSGQLSFDFEGLGVRVTSEIDLLYTGESVELLHEVDYKSGHKQHGVYDVADSFQFQLHGLLVFENYPEVNGLEIVVWNTRTNHRSYRVIFDRKRLPDFKARVQRAIQAYIEHQADPPTWPTVEKCALCPAAIICPAADEPMKDLAADPVGFVQRMVAIETRLEAMKALAVKHVDATGQDIKAGSVCFGRHKPPSNRKSPASLYEPTTTDAA